MRENLHVTGTLVPRVTRAELGYHFIPVLVLFSKATSHCSTLTLSDTCSLKGDYFEQSTGFNLVLKDGYQ